MREIPQRESPRKVPFSSHCSRFSRRRVAVVSSFLYDVSSFLSANCVGFSVDGSNWPGRLSPFPLAQMCERGPSFPFSGQRFFLRPSRSEKVVFPEEGTDCGPPIFLPFFPLHGVHCGQPRAPLFFSLNASFCDSSVDPPPVADGNGPPLLFLHPLDTRRPRLSPFPGKAQTFSFPPSSMKWYQPSSGGRRGTPFPSFTRRIIFRHGFFFFFPDPLFFFPVNRQDLFLFSFFDSQTRNPFFFSSPPSRLGWRSLAARLLPFFFGPPTFFFPCLRVETWKILLFLKGQHCERFPLFSFSFPRS